MGDDDADPVVIPAEDAPKGKAASKKVIAVVVVGALLSASGLYVWHEYYRHWSISDLERAAIVVEWEFKSSTFPNALGFKQHLAGRTVIVEGIVQSAETMITTLGSLTFVYLEGSTFCGLMLWDEPAPEDGTRVEIPITFEWGTINGEEGVYSRQTTLPGFGVFAQCQPVVQSISWTSGRLALWVDDTGDEVILSLEGCPEPTPLEMVRCSLMTGVHMGTQDYIDLMGEYSENPCVDMIQNLSECVSMNGTITFEDDDGYLDGGDSFTLKNLSRPDTSSGAQTYLLSVERDLYPFEADERYLEHVLSAYIIVTREGVLWATDPEPEAERGVVTAVQSTLPEGEAFTVDHTWGNLSWNGSAFLFSDDWGHAAGWDVPLGVLDSGSPETRSLGVKDLGSLRIELIASDLTGNGLIDAGDRMEIVAREGTSLVPGERYEFIAICLMTGVITLDESFTYLAEPVSECALTTTEDLASVVFGPVHNGTGEDHEDVDVVWGEVLVGLESDGNATEWHLVTDDLWAGGQISWESDISALDGISLTCSVLDLQGNGAVDAGDRVEISALPAENGFDPDAVYTVSFIYLPTGSTIFSGTFSGAI